MRRRDILGQTAAAGALMADEDNKSLQMERGIGFYTLPGMARGPWVRVVQGQLPARGGTAHSAGRQQSGQDKHWNTVDAGICNRCSWAEAA